jgi:tetratricopeptide (TPR) repeat protein
MSDAPERPALDAARARLLQGQQLEAEGDFTGALRAYDDVLAISRQQSPAETEVRRQLGIAWMNRGNAEQKLGGYAEEESARKSHLENAIRSYDEAVAHFQSLPRDVPAFHNHLGAAWLNRGHALLVLEQNASAADSLERALAELATLPVEENPNYRLNLAGARVNLAQAILTTSPARAREEAATAVGLVSPLADSGLEFAEMSLRARRTGVIAIGGLLVQDDAPVSALASEASDLVDDGLTLTHGWESQGNKSLRPLAFSLFQLGIQLYGAHQPHFLGEFVLENVGPGAPFSDDGFFRRTAEAALSTALSQLKHPEIFVAGTPQSDRLLQISSSLRAAQQQLRASGVAQS